MSFVILALSVLGFLLAVYHVWVERLRIAEPLLGALEREENMDFPGMGAIYYGFGVGLSLLLYCPVVAKASICALAYGDAFSTLVGKMYGKTPVPWNKGLSLEGSLAFVFFTFLFGSFFVPWQMALGAGVLGALVETVPYVDDNISIPVLVGYALHFAC